MTQTRYSDSAERDGRVRGTGGGTRMASWRDDWQVRIAPTRMIDDAFRSRATKIVIFIRYQQPQNARVEKCGTTEVEW